MKKQELLALANIGKTEIAGFPCEVIIKDCLGSPFLTIRVDSLSPLHRPLILGQKWVEYITDEECAKLPKALNRYKQEAEEFCRRAETVVKATLNEDGTYTFTDIPDAVKKEWEDFPAAFKRWAKERHKISFINDEYAQWCVPGIFTLELNGIQYVPHWSYWLDCAYYETDDQIKSLLMSKALERSSNEKV